MLSTAKANRAYGKKQRRMMNSQCRPMYKIGFDRRLSACACQIPRYCSGRAPAIRRRPIPVTRKLIIAPARSSVAGNDQQWILFSFEGKQSD